MEAKKALREWGSALVFVLSPCAVLFAGSHNMTLTAAALTAGLLFVISER